MTPFMKHVVKELGTLSGEHKLPAAARKLLAEAAESLLRESEKLVAGLSYEAYSAASGHEIELRAVAKGPGVKRFTVHRKIGGGVRAFYPECVIAGVVSARWGHGVLEPERDSKKDQAGNPARYKAVECVRAQLLKSHGKAIRAVLSGLRSDPASLKRAQDQTDANRRRSRESSRRHALVRLSEAMRGHDYTKEEVVESWEMSQVAKVMES